MRKKSIKKIPIGMIVLGVFVIGIIIYKLSSSYSLLENGERVKPNSELTYYIDVIYDGKDEDVITSNDSTTAKVYSDYIYVEDKLPEGLTFVRFITADDGTVGAKRRNSEASCPGHVVGDAAGLHYDSVTNTVSFKVKSLQAGCKLTVGVVTKTPELGDAKRKDFYNTASARENELSLFSNTVHVFMGKEDMDKYEVEYQYSGTVPENAPDLPITNNYISGATVGVASNVNLSGYTFSGWSTTDVEVNNGIFTMPEGKVTFTGSFTENPKYNVSYQINGEAPVGYVAPDTKSYNVGDDVIIDSLVTGELVNGYRFLGWTIDKNIDISDGIFVMPSSNVKLTGSFEKVTYTVSYEFQGNVLPPNAASLLPDTAEYSGGEIVTLADNPEVDGYNFLGWYANDTFEMPERNLTIYGEWERRAGEFVPSIESTVVNQKDYYKESDNIDIKVTITNNNDFPLEDVIITNDGKIIEFTENSNCDIKSNDYVVINTIPANSSVDLYAKVPAGDAELQDYNYNFELVGAITDNNYSLDTSREYKSSVQFRVANIKLNVKGVNPRHEDLAGVKYGLYNDANCTSLVSEGVMFDIKPNNTYYVKEITGPSDNQFEKYNDIIKIVVNEEGRIENAEYVEGVKTIEVIHHKKEETVIDKVEDTIYNVVNNPYTKTEGFKKTKNVGIYFLLISIISALGIIGLKFRKNQ